MEGLPAASAFRARGVSRCRGSACGPIRSLIPETSQLESRKSSNGGSGLEDLEEWRWEKSTDAAWAYAAWATIVTAGEADNAPSMLMTSRSLEATIERMRLAPSEKLQGASQCLSRPREWTCSTSCPLPPRRYTLGPTGKSVSCPKESIDPCDFFDP